MNEVIIFGQALLEEMVFVLRIIQSLWAKPSGGNGVCVNDS